VYHQVHHKCIEKFNIASHENYVNSTVLPALFHHGGESWSRVPVVKPKSSERGRMTQVAFVVSITFAVLHIEDNMGDLLTI